MVIFVVGTTVVLIGVAMIVAPGPAVVVIPAGLAILATEFVWARQLLHRMKATAVGARDRIRGFAMADPPPAENADSAGSRAQTPPCGEKSTP